MKCKCICQRPMRMFFGALLAVMLYVTFSGAASAAVRTVTNLYDAGSGSLRNVLTDAISGDSIVFDAGLNGTILMTHGVLAITKDISIDGGNRITLSGENLNRIFTVTNASLTLSNLSLINGNPPDVDEEFQADSGGALYFDTTSGSRTLTLTNCRVTGNKGDRDMSGAIFASMAELADSLTVNLTDCVLNNNATGGLYVEARNADQGEVTVNIADCKFMANAGSGIVTLVEEPASTVTIMNSLIDGNGVPGGPVRGVRTGARQVTFLMDGCTVSNNTGGWGAAGLRVETTNNASIITVRKSRFIGNVTTADYDAEGAVHLYNDSTGSMRVENCFFASNRSEGGMAGALLLETTSGTIRMTNNTVFGNSARSHGGGVVIHLRNNDTAAVNFYNNIIYGNTLTEGTLGKDIYIDDDYNYPGEGDGIGASAFLSHNIFGPGTQDVYPKIGDNTDYVSNITQDPNLVNPSAGDLHLKATSPAIDAGISAYLKFVYRRIAPYDDIDGDERTPYGEYESCDIGADEYTARTGGNLPAVMLLLLEDD